MPSFISSVLIDAPVDEVFRFHERKDALTVLAPKFPPVKIISKTGGIEKGARVVLRMGIFRWVALHTAYERDQLFADEQIEGPFHMWVHRHEFEAVGLKTRLTDRVAYELPGGLISNLLFGWAVNLGLRNMFAYRHRVTKKICEGERGA